MTEKWSDTAWDLVGPLFTRIKSMPFVRELIDGSLSQERFFYYIHQDSLYLQEYCRVLAGIALRFEDSSWRSSFLRFSSETLVVEQDMHREFFSMSGDGQETSSPSPTCLLYTSYLHRQLAIEPIEVTVAAVLPCFVVYQKTGEYILERSGQSGNPYQRWIDTYGNPDFATDVAEVETISNQLAAATTEAMREKMTEAYVQATRLEWMFWDSAYRLEKWLL